MTSHVQTQRFAATTVRPGVNTRPSGELWLNFPDLRLGMIDPTRTAIDLLPIRFYAPSSSYAVGDFVVNGSQLLQARAAIAPKPFALTDWNQFQSTAQTDNRYLLLSGGTLTGPLTLAGNPTVPAQASNKSYVDSTVAANVSNMVNYVNATVASYVPLAGGNMTGALGVGGSGISYPSFGGYWAAHHVAIGWDGAQPELAVDGTGIGALALQPWTVANFLSINGGTLHGGLNIQGRITWSNLGTNAHAMEFGWDGVEIVAWVDGTFIGGLATYGALSNYLPLTGGVLSGTLRVNNGRLISSSNGNGPSVSCWDISAGYSVGIWAGANHLNFGGFGGDGTASTFWGAFDFGGNFGLQGDLYVGGTIGTVSHFRMAFVGGNYNLYFTDWWLAYQPGDGSLVWYRYDSTALFACSSNGNFGVHGDLNAGANVNAPGNIHAGLALQAIDGSMWFGSGGAGRIMQVANSWYWEWNGGNSDLYWVGPSGRNVEFRVSDGFFGNDRGGVYGYAAYVNLSDERAKANIQPSTHGLPEVLQLEPIAFERTNVVAMRREHGFSAQQVQAVIPEAVVAISQDDEPLLGVTLDPIVAALVNATKELASRIALLEANP